MNQAAKQYAEEQRKCVRVTMEPPFRGALMIRTGWNINRNYFIIAENTYILSGFINNKQLHFRDHVLFNTFSYFFATVSLA